MQITRNILLALLCIFVATSCTQSTDSSKSLFNQGEATLSIKVMGNISDNQKSEPLLLTYNNPITGKEEMHSIPRSENGDYILKTDVPCTLFGTLGAPYYFAIPIIPHEESYLSITYDNEGKFDMEYSNSIGFIAEDMKTMTLMGKQLGHHFSSTGEYDYKTSPEEFRKRGMDNIKALEAVIDSVSNASELGRKIYKNEMRLFFLHECFWDKSYEERIKERYEAETDTPTKPKTLDAKTPDKSYYSFLKEIGLNNPDYLQTTFYPILIKDILNTKALNISPIADQSINKWLADVKKI